ncbi:hypothetical protein JoomaDRAFT_0419 [Galbibacter orientalis DSM 19592]|uniref:Uncharacterized protein n=1 Tax=Galbibacter orientalis DSM 19592 TaxID=926559 RepID=I3C1I1_9FLAO|nr:hypothetical protein JoomaDRAFT_0419 [Galbibacter orientalis DSM 19592]
MYTNKTLDTNIIDGFILLHRKVEDFKNQYIKIEITSNG